jgi:hypothetical protein
MPLMAPFETIRILREPQMIDVSSDTLMTIRGFRPVSALLKSKQECKMRNLVTATYKYIFYICKHTDGSHSYVFELEEVVKVFCMPPQLVI